MGKLIVHVGNARAVLMDDVTVLGSVLSTPQEMSLIGRGQRLPKAGEVKQVFTNNDHAINGLRIAVKMGELDYSAIEIRYHPPGVMIRKHELIKLDADGNYDKCVPGFMDQSTNDLLQLF